MTFDPTRIKYAEGLALMPQFTELDKAALLFLEREDYYQNMEQYVGPKPAPGDVKGAEYIEQSFVALAKLGELARRFVSGAVGQEPAFETVNPTAAEGSEPGELQTRVDTALGTWWDNERMAETVELFTGRLVASLTAQFHYGVAPGLVRDIETPDGMVTAIEATSLEDALDLIYCESPEPGSAFIYTDPETRQEYGVYKYSEPVPDSTHKKTRNCIEISWCPVRDERGRKIENPLTKVVILKDEQNGVAQEFQIDTGGVPLVVGATFHPLVFAALASRCNISLNNAINTALTMAKINTDIAGFPQQTHVDIDPPVVDTGRKDENDNPITEPAEIEVGARTSPFLSSQILDSPDGKGGVTSTAMNGRIFWREPVSNEPLLVYVRFMLRALYESANQAHVLEALSPDSSGVARVEARADFARALLKIARKLEGSLRDVLRGVRCMAAYLAQDQLEEMKALRDNVTCHPNSGPLTPDEKRLILEMVAAKVLAPELAMVMVGIEDVQANVDALQKAQQSELFDEPALRTVDAEAA